MPPTAIDTALTGTITKCLPDGLRGIHGVRGLRLDSPAGTRIYVASATGKPSGGPWEIRPEQEAERDPIAVIHAGVTRDPVASIQLSVNGVMNGAWRVNPINHNGMRYVITLSDDTRKPRGYLWRELSDAWQIWKPELDGSETLSGIFSCRYYTRVVLTQAIHIEDGPDLSLVSVGCWENQGRVVMSPRVEPVYGDIDHPKRGTEEF
ncbi:hypothetical protein DFH09DRAFT_1103826 [Mycena vulgaris]|nr:hypothetical protein DFH09DRAFT_1103826 [Mycena vulgaris]